MVHAGRPHAHSISEGGPLVFGGDGLARKLLSMSNLNPWLTSSTSYSHMGKGQLTMEVSSSGRERGV